MAIAGKLLKIATAAAVLAGSLALSEPAFARGGGGGGGGGHGGGFGGGGFHGGGGGWGGGGGGWHGGGGGWGGRGWGGGPGWRGGGWGGGWGGGGWGGPAWWGVPIIVGGAYYYPYDGYYADDYPVARQVYVQRVAPRSCIWRRVRVRTPSGLRWRKVRYCAH
jgi:hypothetical protein